MAKEFTINLGDFKTSDTSRVFSGRPRGEECRRLMQLDMHDVNGDVVNIIIPSGIFSINMSFFLALFGKSVRTFGSVEKFYSHYNFSGPSVHLRAIAQYVQEALKSSIALPSLKKAV